MSAVSPSITLAEVKQFLVRNGWRIEKRSSGHVRYISPIGFKSDKPVIIVLPENDESADSKILIRTIANTLSTLYGVDSRQLEVMSTGRANVLTLRILGKSTNAGSIPLNQFESIVESTRKLLLDQAAYSISDDVQSEEHPEGAFRYLNECQILQSDAGSYVMRLKLPSSIELRQASLFSDRESVTAGDVNRHLLKTIRFICGDVMSSQSDVYSDESIAIALGTFNLSILEDMQRMLTTEQTEKIEFTVYGNEGSERIETPWLTDKPLETLIEYVRYFREKVEERVPINVRGLIIELRSRDPVSGRNHVLIEVTATDARFLLSVILPNDLYADALHIHEQKRLVHVVGVARRMKTQLKMISLEQFTSD